jgi:hypothetical protein
MNQDEDRDSPLQVLLNGIDKEDNREPMEQYMLNYTE